jgi:Mrp family chromosome partitioning ATPase
MAESGDSGPKPKAFKARSTVMGLAPAPHLSAAPAEPKLPDLRGTQIMSPAAPFSPVALPKADAPSERQLPSASGWEVHESAPEIQAELVVRTPTTARMIRTAEPARMTPSQAPPPELQTVQPHAPTALAEPPPQTTALALRREEPQYAPRHGLTGPIDRRLDLIIDPHSARSASFRLLRDSLLSRSLPRVVAVTSPTANDGKTTCAVNLALALAEQAATRVLLVDGNFFQPELATIFTLERLVPIAFDDSSGWLAPYRIAGVTPTLHVAGVIRAPGEPVRFEQYRFDQMVDRLCRVAYDYIIIDTPAMRATPAVVQMVTIADGTILAARSGATSSADLRRAAEQIPGKKALGIALVDAPQV